MQVRLITTVETIIDIDQENTDKFEAAKAEIFDNTFHEFPDFDEITEEVKSAHIAAVVYDKVRSQSVTHTFEEVK